MERTNVSWKLVKKFELIGWTHATEITDTSFSIVNGSELVATVTYEHKVSIHPALVDRPLPHRYSWHDIAYTAIIFSTDEGDDRTISGTTDTEALNVPNTYCATLVCNALFVKLVTRKRGNSVVEPKISDEDRAQIAIEKQLLKDRKKAFNQQVALETFGTDLETEVTESDTAAVEIVASKKRRNKNR